LAAAVAAPTAAVEAASTVAVEEASTAAGLAEAVSVQPLSEAEVPAQPLSEAAVSARPLSEAEVSAQLLSEAAVSAQPLLGAVDFAVEPSQPMVSAAAVSTTGSATMGADLRSVHLQSD
jgi:hypothetical protein